jgi:hypothetical protein
LRDGTEVRTFKCKHKTLSLERRQLVLYNGYFEWTPCSFLLSWTEQQQKTCLLRSFSRREQVSIFSMTS